MGRSAHNIESVVLQVIADVLEKPAKEINMRASFAHDLGAGELDMAEILTNLEYQLTITIPDFDEGRVRTVDRLTHRILACYRREYGRF
ncbi:MAG: hypothetical protein A3J55_02105 [Candidatus Ryanbacteria bacterium RIFCSPHIGHO2_02_FULL_45_17b]|uniref:Carrier domain-containing protein n=1 Tax=Candidatus Ryanbacteria bacterium RIFCSPHIGHO2_01_FULL_45_22 TaxID=1802114 RepID=A0A1G2FYM7_9BACT|nr:MAG: hypothetical protein A2719_00550 [Candidatus Ryanbacteria bacterium RIFCSPHIGHO2_01_FULL_45_22]OGZ46733.1 MAG: hypothetical protein A3J55_02105 [Candidatus Ryanbacteria bacterium RIFCSPHIGHO2_02_FULL_45_17b]